MGLSDIDVKLNLESFFNLRTLIRLLRLTSISLGKSRKITLIWPFFPLKWLYKVVVVAFNILPPTTSALAVATSEGTDNRNMEVSDTDWYLTVLCHIVLYLSQIYLWLKLYLTYGKLQITIKFKNRKIPLKSGHFIQKTLVFS